MGESGDVGINFPMGKAHWHLFSGILKEIIVGLNDNPITKATENNLLASAY